MARAVVERQSGEITTFTFSLIPGTATETIRKLKDRFSNQEQATMSYLDDGSYAVGPFRTARARRRALGILHEYVQVDRESITFFGNDILNASVNS